MKNEICSSILDVQDTKFEVGSSKFEVQSFLPIRTAHFGSPLRLDRGEGQGEVSIPHAALRTPHSAFPLRLDRGEGQGEVSIPHSQPELPISYDDFHFLVVRAIQRSGVSYKRQRRACDAIALLRPEKLGPDLDRQARKLAAKCLRHTKPVYYRSRKRPAHPQRLAFSASDGEKVDEVRMRCLGEAGISVPHSAAVHTSYP